MDSKSAKYAFWGAVMAAVITGAIGLYIHLDGKTEQKRIIEQKNEADQSKDTANLTISNVYVPPINTSQDSSFFFEISNNSLNVAKNINVKINFGEASITSCETLPENHFKAGETYDSSIVTFPAGDIQKKDKLYVYCMISSPVFESILITGPNLFSNEKLEFSDLNGGISSENSGFLTFFKVVATIVAVIFIGYFTIVILSLLNKRFNIE